MGNYCCLQVRDIKFKLDFASKKLSVVKTPKRLIITSGDTSDVDGFLALAEYSKVPDIQKTSAFTYYLFSFGRNRSL